MDGNNYSIGIANYAYDIDGALLIHPVPGENDTRSGVRRVTRTATLDGGCVVVDGGVSDSDRTLDLSVESAKDLWEAVWALFNSAVSVVVSTDDGCYLAKLEKVSEKDARINLSILIQARISE